MTQPIIGFIGLGRMGSPMASNLLRSGYALNVYDLQTQAVDLLVKQGANAKATLAELANSSEIVITSVQTSQQVQAICLQADGLFANMQAGKLYIDCSSIDIKVTRELHNQANQDYGIAMLDAPVSGGVSAAKAGSLTVMVGGQTLDYEKALPLLTCIGKKIIHAGSGGSGQAAKICNNLLLGISMIGVCEAFSLAEKLGLDAKKFFEISSNASGQCWSMTSYCPVPGLVETAPSNYNYQPGFMAKMMLKDLRLAQHAAEEVNSAIPLGAAATELYELFVNQQGGEQDFSGMINFINPKSIIN